MKVRFDNATGEVVIRLSADEARAAQGTILGTFAGKIAFDATVNELGRELLRLRADTNDYGTGHSLKSQQIVGELATRTHETKGELIGHRKNDGTVVWQADDGTDYVETENGLMPCQCYGCTGYSPNP